ncbi:MAG: isoprenylcysteine carboxyl methyltransferase [Firmicutes bacterium]|nr:isoprenylcysteine carboxyl methyltransferase [Bacillota bacterium]
MSLKFKYYSANLLVIYLVLAFYLNNKYYIDFLRIETQYILGCYAVLYTLGGFIYYYFIDEKKVSETKGYIALRTIRNFLKHSIVYLGKFTSDPNFKMPHISFTEKTNLLFLAVKIFFFPIMINFIFGNIDSVIRGYAAWTLDYNVELTVGAFNNAIYPLLFGLLLLVDCSIFTFGYMVDAKIFRNKIRSVEPTMLGWIVALLCYPPFNNITNYYISCYADDYAVFDSDNITFLARLTALMLFTIYVWGSVALGMKASNLTNRGIVTNGPYAYVRHPAYISKNLAWWISIFAINTPTAYIGMIFLSFIYFMRAITEERHLITDPDYQEYCKVVKYRFIPGLY